VRLPADAKQFTNCATVAASEAEAKAQPGGGADAPSTACHTVNTTPPTQPGAGGPNFIAQPAQTPVPAKAIQPTCFSNMVADANGQCACPPGTNFNGRQCQAPVGGGGLSVVPGGGGGLNKAVQPLQCPPGTVGVFPDCRGTGGFDKIQPGQQKPCPPGTIGVFPDCRPSQASTSPGQQQVPCPRGTIGVFPNCRPLGPGTGGFDKIQPEQQPPHCSGGKCICPPGFVDVGATCVRPAQQANCPTGTSGIFPKCTPTGSGGINKSQPGVPQNCPAGTSGIFPKCTPTGSGGINKSQPGVPQNCPAGTSGIFPKCTPTGSGGINKSQPSVPQKCPAGTFGDFPKCFKIGSGGINKSQSGQTKAAPPPVAKPRPAKPRPKPKPKQK
jgi:hypothetical protein